MSATARLKNANSETSVTPLLPIWQHWALLILAYFFAFGAPLICWGAVADPAHAHATAHFLFFEPPIPNGRGGHLLTNCNAAGFVHGLSLPSVDNSSHQEPAGAARPMVTLISLLLLIFVSLLNLRLHLPKCLLRAANTIHMWDFTLPVLTPPPRLSPFA